MQDLISRQAAIDALEESKKTYFDRRVIIGKMQDILVNLPSAQPEKCEDCGNFNKTRLVIPQSERKTGRWIYHPEIKNIYGGKCIECSECGEKYMVVYIEDEKYCRNCGSYNGAKTEEEG